MAIFGSCIVSCVSLALLVVVESENVPVLMWSKSDLKGIDPRWESSKAVQEAFTTIAVKPESETIVVFLQNQLGFNDLAQYGGVYGGTSSVLSKMKGLSEKLPFLTIESNVYLENPAAEALADKGFEISREAPMSCEQVKKKAFFVDLPQETVSEKALEAADLAVSQTVTLLESCKVSFTVVFTSSTPVMDTHLPRVGRGLFESPSNSSNNTSKEDLFFVVETDIGIKNTTCVMVYFAELTYFELSENATTIDSTEWTWSSKVTVDTVVTVDGACGENCSGNATFAWLSFGNNRTLNETVEREAIMDTIKFIFPCSGNGYWDIDIELTLGDTMTEGVLLPMVRHDGINLSIPLDLSYHCTTELLWTNFYINTLNSSSSTTSYGVNITSLQVQAYTNGTSNGNRTFEFTTVYDCQPYFSEAVWMGIACVLPLFLMLYCSMAFLFQMETMDKFDDPRGKTISVAGGR